MAKAPASCDWVGSGVTEEMRIDFLVMRALLAQDVIHWWVPGNEVTPKPQEGEVIVFTEHLLRGYSPPGSKLF